MLYRYVAGLQADGYEWAYGDGCGRRADPDQRRRDLRVRRHHAGADARDCDGRASSSLHGLCSTEPRPRSPTGSPRQRPADRDPRLGRRARHIRRSWGPGWALVGDAGYFKDPITTHGMTDALRDAELLADAVLEALTGGTPEAVALARTRDHGTGCRRACSRRPRRSRAYDWDTGGVQALLRQVSSAMSDEVDHLQARPDRRTTDGSVSLLPPDWQLAR